MTLNEITREQLKEMYVDKDMTLQQIAEELDTTRFKVSDKIKEYSIVKDQRLRTRHKDVPSKEELIDMYINKNMNIQDIANVYSLNRITISRLIKKYNINKDSSLIRKNAGDKRRAKNNLDIDDTSWKDKVYDLYITQNKTRKETADELGINLSQLLTILNKYNITKSKELNIKKRKETSLKRYGADNPAKSDIIKERNKKKNLERYGTEYFFQSDEFKRKAKETWKNNLGVDNPFKSKEVREKIRETNLKKYGVASVLSLKETREKLKASNIDKFGAEYPFGSNEVRQKIINTFISRYGVDNPLKSDEIKDKVIKTNIERYGSTSPFGNKDIIKKSQETRKNNVKEKYERTLNNINEYLERHSDVTLDDISNNINIPYSTAAWYVKEYNLEDKITYHKSRLETYFKEFLDKYSIEYIQNDRMQIKPKELDFYIPKANLAIEINDTASHNSTLSFRNTSNIRPYNYHFNKTQLAKKKGIHLIHIFEYEMMDKDKYNKITNYIKSILDIDTIRIYARNCEVKEISSKEAREFLDTHHFQNYASSSIKLGLYYKNELVEVMTFGKPRFNKNYEYELIRLCTSSSYKVIGGSQKLFKYFLNKYNPKSIISYCDVSKFTGDVYEKLGFTLVEYTQPNYVWTNYVNTFPRYLTQKHKLKEMFNDLNDDYTEDSAMMSHGYVKIYDCGNARYEFKRD